MNLKEIIKNLLIWFVVFSTLLLGYSYKNELAVVWQRVYGNLMPGKPVQLQQYEVQVHKNSFGQYDVEAEISGQKIKFLVDTGASNVLLKWEDAILLGYNPQKLNFSTNVSTANGVTKSAPVIIDAIFIGDIKVYNVKALVAQQGAVTISLLGMTFLERLSSYVFNHNTLIIKGYNN